MIFMGKVRFFAGKGKVRCRIFVGKVRFFVGKVRFYVGNVVLHVLGFSGWVGIFFLIPNSKLD